METKDHSIIEERNVLRLNNAESNRLTRECLTTALMQLMKEKPIDKITITELVKRSGVSRTAFYRNYSSKEDILESAREEIIQITNGFLAKPELKENSYLWFKECFNIVQENAEIIKTIIDANLPVSSFWEGRSMLETLYPSGDRLKRYRNLAMAAAFQRVLCLWVEDGMVEPMEEMAEFCSLVFQERPIMK
ncbi:MAG: TetR/AcrR family transcriptional regulator [Lachnospiraceae bacterium]|nr:TetR/AcrR family transcriptional regulator [Lachnospiraceae bacterium]MBR5733261.1 TetR/AcrR family transcriptional regulator [Lachnospiraceae bacterium]